MAVYNRKGHQGDHTLEQPTNTTNYSQMRVKSRKLKVGAALWKCVQAFLNPLWFVGATAETLNPKP